MFLQDNCELYCHGVDTLNTETQQVAKLFLYRSCLSVKFTIVIDACIINFACL